MKVNMKKLALASILVFLAFEAMDYFIHGVLLSGIYAKLAAVWRPDMMSKMWILWISTFVMSVLFVYIFAKGYENKGLAEGVRFGIVIGLFMNVIGMFSQYVMYPIPLSLSVKWFVFGMLEFVVAGIIASLVYKPAK